MTKSLCIQGLYVYGGLPRVTWGELLLSSTFNSWWIYNSSTMPIEY